ncbi:MAG: cell wall-binding repeat-containing protein [Firmicutes bacterium]|nr:cell wall-binding repeat-containing protein [Bacillota bacterium]
MQTASLIDSYLYQQHLTQATTLYVANGVTMVDALAASPWLARAAAPLWLGSPGETALPSAALTWLEQANIHQVVLLGGPAAVTPGIAPQLSSLGVQVTRLAGADRDATAAAIPAQAFPHPAGANLAADGSRGSSFVDALPAGPLGAVWNLPVVLSGPNQLPGATASYLQALSPSSLWVMGGPAAIHASVLQALDSLMGTPSP